ncbi:hypothetical protein GCM10017783_09500 [Deinococcus piscis]|uniref:Lipoprotein n=1 Tax=Deinococcus piscis TaxID=394230 RepID=A0ABQ3K4I1_9DEIO|nr:hypothetical protein [Deinococcus piscis]GHF99532.1 hypothetical protein GCM10017783_09500 [Deinococcus piscis]
MPALACRIIPPLSRLATALYVLGLTLGLSACAPAPAGSAAPVAGARAPSPQQRETRLPAATTPQVQAAFSEEGAVWSDGRQACVARLPQLKPVCPRWPAPTGAVAWNGGRAWAALPTLGQVVTVDGAAETLPAGRVVAMSSTRIYREDGSALSYSAAEMPGTLGRPTQVLTGGDGRDYALVADRFWQVDRGHSEKLAAGSHFLLAVPGGAEVTRVPTLDAPLNRLELRGGQIFRPGDQTPLSLPGRMEAFGMIGNRTYILVRAAAGWELIALKS